MRRQFLTIVICALFCLTAGSTFAQSQEHPYAQYSEDYQITAADRDSSDLKKLSMEALHEPFETLKAESIETGILYDRTSIFSAAEKHDGQGENSVSYSSWRQLYQEMQLSQVSPAAELAGLGESGVAIEQSTQSGAIPILVLNAEYNKIKESALDEGLLEERGGRFYDISGPAESPYEKRTAFAAAAAVEELRDRTATFELSKDYYFESHTAALPTHFEVDLGDGKGFKHASFGDQLTASYASDGARTARLRAHYPDGSIMESAFTLRVNQMSMPDCGLTWGTPGATEQTSFAVSDGEYEGEPAYFTACAVLAEGHSSLVNPLILVEGFDRNSEQDIERIYNIILGSEFTGALSEAGYDLVILNFYDATTYIQRNVQALITLIDDINELKTTREPNVVVGASMGGLVARYALSLMETNGEEHETTVYVSFDSPHRGANIPLGLQYTIHFFSVIDDAADGALEDINSPAAKQMLAYHFGSSNSEIPKPDQLRFEFDSELNVNSEGPDRRYPRENGIWKVAVANGSGYARAQRDNDGNEMPSGGSVNLYAFENRTLGFGVFANAYAMPEGGARTKVFKGDQSCFPNPFVDCDRSYNSEHYIDAYDPPMSLTSEPYDNAPGGYTTTAQDIVALSEDAGSASTSWERHSFVPTISALDLFVSNALFDASPLFYDISADPALPNKTPLDLDDEPFVYSAFDIFRYAYENERHVDLTSTDLRRFLFEQFGYVPQVRTIAGEVIDARKSVLRSRSETVLENVTLTQDADVVLASGGSIRLGPGFRAERGSRFLAYTDPTLGETTQPSLAALGGQPSESLEGEDKKILATDESVGGAAEKAGLSASAVEAPSEFKLLQNYPNPSAGSTTIDFDLPEATDVSLDVYDVLGRRVSRLVVDREMSAGHHSVRLSASHLSSGVYIYRLRAGQWSDAKRMVLVK